jgi:hypothetical protein
MEITSLVVARLHHCPTILIRALFSRKKKMLNQSAVAVCEYSSMQYLERNAKLALAGSVCALIAHKTYPTAVNSEKNRPTGTHIYVHGTEKQRLREGRERERESSTIRGHLHPYPLLRRSGTRRSAYDTQVNVVRYSLSDPLVDHTYLPWTEGAGSSSNIPFSSFRFTCAVAAEVEML